MVIFTNSNSILSSNSKINKIKNEQYNQQIEKMEKQANKQEKINQNKIKSIRIEQKQLYKKLYQTKNDNEKAKLHVQINKNNQKINDLEN